MAWRRPVASPTAAEHPPVVPCAASPLGSALAAEPPATGSPHRSVEQPAEQAPRLSAGHRAQPTRKAGEMGGCAEHPWPGSCCTTDLLRGSLDPFRIGRSLQARPAVHGTR